MIDVVQALELFEICADEMGSENAADENTGRRRMSLTARALAKQELHVAHLARFPLRESPGTAAIPGQPAMTLGALIVFRTADKFGRAGASTDRTIDAIYHAVQRYLDIIPRSLQDQTDASAIGALIADAQHLPLPARQCSTALRTKRLERVLNCKGPRTLT